MKDSQLIDTKYKVRYEQLIILRRQMMSQIGTLEESLINDCGAGEELADIGSNAFGRETNINILNTEEIELDEIDDAIEKMFSGTYGICQDCGLEIEKGRLDAKPFAKYCLKDKEIHEKRDLGYDV